MILILSHMGDDHTVGVLKCLQLAKHPVFVMDSSEFPRLLSLTQRFGKRSSGYQLNRFGRSIDLGTCRVAWWRRPQPFQLDPALAPDVVEFSYSECNEAVAGLWAALGMKWVNPPELDALAHHKPYQLAVAASVGLSIPDTVITNDPAEAQKFVSEQGYDRTVYKTFLATEKCWRETRMMRPEEQQMLHRVQLAPVIFQEYVAALADIRVTVVGEKIFAAKIQAAPDGYTLDYRMDMDAASFEPTTLSHETEIGLRRLMDKLGLVYGAIDLRRTDNRGDVFLEINPAGEWRFVEERTGQAITQSVAELLVQLDQLDG